MVLGSAAIDVTSFRYVLRGRSARRKWLCIAIFYCSTLSLSLSGGVRAANWTEGADGDLSNNRLSPSSFSLTAGTNSLMATMPGSDLDYVTLNIPANHELSELTLASYASTDGTSFIGMQEGTQVTTTGSASVLLGYAHFGAGPGNVGQNILPAMCNGPGAIGCTPPLASGPYSFWIQQQSGANVTYQFDFTVTARVLEGLPGDYNDDSIVSAADYTVWRDNLGAAAGTLPNDTDDGPIGAAQYETWKTNYGATDNSTMVASESASVPEPASLLLVFAAGGACLTYRRLAAWRRWRMSGTQAPLDSLPSPLVVGRAVAIH